MFDAKKTSVVAQLDVLNTFLGHDKEIITIEDNDPRKREKLARTVQELIRDGYRVALEDGTVVKGYDADENEWLVRSGDKKRDKKKLWERITAMGKVATAVAPARGG